MNRVLTVLGWVLVVIGFGAVAAGWAGVQSTPVVPVQLAYLASGGLGGVALVIFGASLQNHDDVRAIRESVEELRDRFDDLEHDVADAKEILEVIEDPQLARISKSRRSAS